MAVVRVVSVVGGMLGGEALALQELRGEERDAGHVAVAVGVGVGALVLVHVLDLFLSRLLLWFVLNLKQYTRRTFFYI